MGVAAADDNAPKAGASVTALMTVGFSFDDEPTVNSERRIDSDGYLRVTQPQATLEP
jgi:hypothetical protein